MIYDENNEGFVSSLITLCDICSNILWRNAKNKSMKKLKLMDG